jgi:Na+/citrate or Na+/malate symporter
MLSMNARIDWARTLRAIVIATVLLIALIGAVLASIGTRAPVWLWAGEGGARGAALPHDPAQPARG